MAQEQIRSYQKQITIHTKVEAADVTAKKVDIKINKTPAGREFYFSVGVRSSEGVDKSSNFTSTYDKAKGVLSVANNETTGTIATFAADDIVIVSGFLR